MSKLLKEIKWNILNTPIMSSVFVFMLTIGFLLSNITFSMTSSLFKQAKKYEENNASQNYYQITDPFSSGESDNENTSGRLTKVFTLYEKIKSCTDFSYYEISSHEIEFPHENLPNEFINNDSNLLTSTFLSKNVFEDFNLQLHEGRFFTEEEYMFDLATKDKEITLPIILGYKYKEFFKLNQEIDMGNRTPFLPSKFKYKYKIIGFLNHNAYIQKNRGVLYSLEKDIIIPSYNFKSFMNKNYTDDSHLYTIWGMIKTNGIIKTSMSEDQVQSIVSNYSNDLDIVPNYIVLYANYKRLVNTKHIDDILSIFKITTLAIIIFSIFLVVIFTSINVQKNLKYYAILSITGFRHTDILKIIFFQPLLLMLTSYLISLIFTFIFIYILNIEFVLTPYIICFFFGIIITIVAGIYAYKKNITEDLSVYLKKR